MKRSLILVLVILLITVSCPKKEMPSLKLLPSIWDETNKYQILIDTVIAGSYWLIYKSVQEPEPVIELQSITEITQVGSVSRDSTALVLRGDNLKPISSSKTILTSGMTINADIAYGKTKASVKAKLPQGDKAIYVPININTYDNDQVTTILRALELKQDEEKEINVVIGFSGTTVPVKIKLLGEEKITGPAGAFDCHKYTITVVGRMIDVWCEKADAKRMVKYFDTQASMTMELLP
jgi:hypothetical protein